MILSLTFSFFFLLIHAQYLKESVSSSTMTRDDCTVFSSDPQSWVGQHFLSATQITLPALELFLREAEAMKELVKVHGGDLRLQGRILGSIFFEPSTRTTSSFQAAFQRLGGSCIHVNESSSSAQKGETLSDTVRSMACYCDVVVLRHPVQGSVREAAMTCPKPLLNAGDGTGEHPTQSLLDLLTVKLEVGEIRNKTVAFVGDLKHGRTAHSFARLLCLFSGIRLIYVSPQSLAMPEEVKKYVDSRGVQQHEYFTLDEDVLATMDVLYMTRVQKERFPRAADYEKVKDIFRITPQTMQLCKCSLVLMHPLPRVGEIDDRVDQDPRAAYFRQMENGMYARMALIALIMGVSGVSNH
jgi:carbamoyl-phosphate synthase/aspartate carbamoyltransferase/dihydroorotase